MTSALEKLKMAVAKTKSGSGGFKDPHADKFWKIEGDAAGNGYAIIRFLPGKTEDDLPYVKLYNHGFKSDTTGRWFIENCPTTLEKECPACKANSKLWNSGLESDKEIVRKRKRKSTYISNILVVSDPKNPENEGKTFYFKYGQKVFDKIMSVLSPEFEDEAELNPFDLKDGANFKLKMRKVDGWSNFDRSEFDAPSPVKGGQKIVDEMNNLTDLIAPSEFKSFEELEAKLHKVLGTEEEAPVPSKAKRVEEDADDTPPPVKSKPAPKAASEDSEDDDDLEYFRRMASE